LRTFRNEKAYLRFSEAEFSCDVGASHSDAPQSPIIFRLHSLPLPNSHFFKTTHLLPHLKPFKPHQNRR